MENNISLKYKDLIYEYSLITKGSPAVFRVPSKTQKIGHFLKKTVGVKKPSMKSKTVLLLGETGNGKSTIVNVLFNFAIKTKWTDEIWCEIVDEQIDDVHAVQSQTSEVIVYEINEGELGFSLTVIDTPGLGDTRGTDHLLVDRLLELFESKDGVSEIHAVGLVLKATENRLSDRMAYILNSVTSFFNKSISQNIVVLFTHSDGRKPTNALHGLEAAKIKCARNENNEPVYFLFDNCQRDDRTEDTKYLKLANETTMTNVQRFMEYLQKQERKNLTQTVDVLRKRISLRTCIDQLKEQVKLIKDKEEQIYKTEKAIEKYTLKMESTRHFETEEHERYISKEKIDSGGWIFQIGAVCCVTCEKNCHYPGCTWAWGPSYCAVMKNGICTVCECPVENHVKEDWKYVDNFKKVRKVNIHIQKIHNVTKRKTNEKKHLLNSLKSELSDIRENKNKCLEEAFSTIEQLEMIALNVDSVFTYVHLEFLIEELQKNKHTAKVQTLKRLRDQMDDRNKAGIKYL